MNSVGSNNNINQQTKENIMENNNSNIINPFINKEIVRVSPDNSVVSFVGEDWYSQSYVDALQETIRSRSQLVETHRSQRDAGRLRLSTLAQKVSEYLAEHDDDETVDFFSDFINDEYGVIDPRRKEYEMEVVVNIKHTYRVLVRCAQEKFDDMIEHLEEHFHSEDSPSKYDMENEWCIVDDIDDYGSDVDDVEVSEV